MVPTLLVIGNSYRKEHNEMSKIRIGIPSSNNYFRSDSTKFNFCDCECKKLALFRASAFKLKFVAVSAIACVCCIYLLNAWQLLMKQHKLTEVRPFRDNWDNPPRARSQAPFGSPGPLFYRRKHNFDCARIIQGDPDELRAARNGSRKLTNEYQLWQKLANCSDFFTNYAYYPRLPITQVEAEFPIAYVILLDQDAEQVEALVHSIYAPQNRYCLHIDWKAPKILHDVFERFAHCLPNVHVTKSESVFWSGFTMLKAMLNCLRDLDEMDYAWKYVVILQGHDFPLKTNREIVEILQIHQGANDVEMIWPLPTRYQWHRDWLTNENGLPVDVIDVRNQTKTPPPGNLSIYKGSVSAAMSRDFIHFLLTNQLSLELQAWLNDTALPDEFLWSTINHNEKLRAPGGYPGKCLGVRAKNWITRYAAWAGTAEPCQGVWRNAVCLFSVADLSFLTAPNRTELFLNKFWLKFDPIALDCMHEWIFNRTYAIDYRSDQSSWIDLAFYRNLSAVRFQRAKAEVGDAAAMLFNFTC